jgi:hypothetical protein
MEIVPLTRYRSTFGASSKDLARPVWRGVFSIDADIFLSIETIALYIIRYRR